MRNGGISGLVRRMSESPYVNFYTSDFLAGTSGMTAACKGVYITLLCQMYEREAPLHQEWDTLARRCGCTLPAFKRAVAALVDDGKLTVTDAGIWSEKCDKHIALRRERQISAKAAAEKRWEKDKRKQRNSDATACSAQCQPEPEPEPYIEEEPKGSLSLCDPAPISPASQAIEIYNRVARDVGWPAVQKPTKARISAINARLQECGGVMGWEHAMQRARGSPLLTGDNDRNWRASFDWLTKAANFTKLMEGNYDPKPRPASQANPNTNSASRAIHDALRMGAAQRFGDGSG
jgi:uncharacterized protein YdaU (DUF1376 family)